MICASVCVCVCVCVCGGGGGGRGGGKRERFQHSATSLVQDCKLGITKKTLNGPHTPKNDVSWTFGGVA